MSMLSKLSQLFKLKKDAPEQLFLQQHQIEYDDEKGFIIEGIVLNCISSDLIVHSS